MLVREAQKTRRQKKIAEIKTERRPSRMLARMRGEFDPPTEEAENVNLELSDEEYSDTESDSDDDDEFGGVNNNADSSYKGQRNLNRSAISEKIIMTRRNKQRSDTNQRMVPETSVIHFSMCHHKRKSTKRRKKVDSSSDSDISAESSVDSDVLDYDYQYGTHDPGSSADVWNFDKTRHDKTKQKLDLVSEDIFTDTEDSDVEFESQPNKVVNQEPFVVNMKRE